MPQSRTLVWARVRPVNGSGCDRGIPGGGRYQPLPGFKSSYFRNGLAQVQSMREASNLCPGFHPRLPQTRVLTLIWVCPGFWRVAGAVPGQVFLPLDRG